jgi:hypothetical protein
VAEGSPVVSVIVEDVVASSVAPVVVTSVSTGASAHSTAVHR